MPKLDVRQAVYSMNMASPVGVIGEDDVWALPMTISSAYRSDKLYTVYVGDNMKRTFDAESMPLIMKDKLSMLLPAVEATKHLHNPEWDGTWKNIPPPYCLEGFKSIGWLEGRYEWGDAYTLIVTWLELMELRGETP